ATRALADKKSEADALFKIAKKLHCDKKYAEACPMFEKSDALDPGIGAKLNVAKCYEDWGMLARAHRWYTDAEAMAASANDKRADKIRELITAIDSDVPRLTLKLPEGADAATAEVKLDGKSAALGKEQRVDPGPHEITWRVEGKTKSKTIPMERGGARELTLDMRSVGGSGGSSDGDVSAPVDKAVVVDSPPAPGRTRRIIGISVGAAGLVGMGVATYLTLDARSKYNGAIDTHCMGSKDMCSDEGLSITSDARSQANIATVVTIVSLAAIGGGIVLYLTAPKGEARESNKSALYVSPVVSGDMGGFVFGGGF
ncbi:MAG: hypothetical protein H0T65_03005, partial [Deltaproteobacteria bacterium]|nr:hypothetical protein [Deltaproteobacteria bacterium]